MLLVGNIKTILLRRVHLSLDIFQMGSGRIWSRFESRWLSVVWDISVNMDGIAAWVCTPCFSRDVRTRDQQGRSQQEQSLHRELISTVLVEFGSPACGDAGSLSEGQACVV